MPSGTVPPELAASIVQGLAKARKERMLKALRETVFIRGHQIAQEEIAATDPPPVDRGEYKAKFKAYNRPNGAIFVNVAKHAGVIEKGRRPGTWPPEEAIDRWVRRKFRLQFSELSNRRRSEERSSFFGLRRRKVRLASQRDRAIKSIVFLVRRKIARDGIPGKHVMARVQARLGPEVSAAVVKAARGFTP